MGPGARRCLSLDPPAARGLRLTSDRVRRSSFRSFCSGGIRIIGAALPRSGAFLAGGAASSSPDSAPPACTAWRRATCSRTRALKSSRTAFRAPASSPIRCSTRPRRTLSCSVFRSAAATSATTAAASASRSTAGAGVGVSCAAGSSMVPAPEWCVRSAALVQARPLLGVPRGLSREGVPAAFAVLVLRFAHFWQSSLRWAFTIGATAVKVTARLPPPRGHPAPRRLPSQPVARAQALGAISCRGAAP